MTKTKTFEAIRAIPKEKLGDKIKKTVLGLGVFVLGAYIVRAGATADPLSLWAIAGGVAVCFIGGVTVSGELFLAPVRAVGEMFTDFYKRIKG